MTKKRSFVDKKNANRFRLLPAHGRGADDLEESSTISENRFVPTAEQLEEQHECGIFFDDDYDYMKHLRSKEDKAHLVRVDEEALPTNIPGLRGHSFPPAPPPPLGSFLFGELGFGEPLKKGKKNDDTLDPEVERVLNGFDDADDMDDDFIKMLGGPVESSFALPQSRGAYDSDEDEDEGDAYMSNVRAKYLMGFDDMDEDEEEDKIVHRDLALQRDIDEGFDSFMEAAYCPEQIGGLDPEDPRMRGVLDPNNPRIIRLISKQKGDPEYDAEFAKEDVRKRLRAWAKEGKDNSEMEMIEVDEGASKRLKWDCESFASQYTNIYNHPAQIREPPGKLSKKALRRIDRLSKQEAEAEQVEEDEMMDDGESLVSTVSTVRPKNETAEERRLRKLAVKDAQRERRVEKKQNKIAFAEEALRVKQQSIGNRKVKQLN